MITKRTRSLSRKDSATRPTRRRTASGTRKSKSVLSIVREYFPRIRREAAEFILFEKTGWPCFFREGEKSLREQLDRYARATKLKRDVCYCCGKIRFKKQLDCTQFCKRGAAMLKEASSQPVARGAKPDSTALPATENTKTPTGEASR